VFRAIIFRFHNAIYAAQNFPGGSGLERWFTFLNALRTLQQRKLGGTRALYKYVSYVILSIYGDTWLTLRAFTQLQQKSHKIAILHVTLVTIFKCAYTYTFVRQRPQVRHKEGAVSSIYASMSLQRLSMTFFIFIILYFYHLFERTDIHTK